MNSVVKMLFVLSIFVSCTAEQKLESINIPIIDQSLIDVDTLIWDLDKLQELPEFEYLDSTSRVREIIFKGVDINGESRKVFAYYTNPDILKTGESQGGKFPGVVLISGGSQPAFKEWVERWALEGYAAITCDYGNNREMPGGMPKSSMEEVYNAISGGVKAIRAYRTTATVIQAHTILLNFPEVIKDKTAVTGISWGGFQTCIVSGLDNRFKAAAPVYGCAFHDEIIFKRELEDRMDEKGKELWMSSVDPKNYLKFSKCPTLFITGDNDGCFDIIPFDKTTKLIPKSNRYIRITPNMGHDHPIGWRPREIPIFFNSILKDEVPLARVENYKIGDELLSFDYKSSMTITGAKFYYTNDTLSINEKRVWSSISADIFEDRVESKTPEEGFVMGFLYITDIMGLSVSSELILK